MMQDLFPNLSDEELVDHLRRMKDKTHRIIHNPAHPGRFDFLLPRKTAASRSALLRLPGVLSAVLWRQGEEENQQALLVIRYSPQHFPSIDHAEAALRPHIAKGSLAQVKTMLRQDGARAPLNLRPLMSEPTPAEEDLQAAVQFVRELDQRHQLKSVTHFFRFIVITVAQEDARPWGCPFPIPDRVRGVKIVVTEDGEERDPRARVTVVVPEGY